MADDQTIRQKQDFIIRALVMCLVDHWTYGGVPKRTLNDLGLDPDRAKMIIRDLVRQRWLLEFITYGDEVIPIEDIIEDNHQFFEAIIFTKEGKRTLREFNLKHLTDTWNRVTMKEEY